MLFETAEAFEKALAKLPVPNEVHRLAAARRQDRLTKPPGSLGRLEEIARHLAGWHVDGIPRAKRVKVAVFAGNHGVTAQGVSPYPASVTQQMVANFQSGGAAINAISSSLGLELQVVPLDLDKPTNDIAIGPAMSAAETLAALNAGADVVDEASDILVLGEMGIGNTTIGAALAAALLGGSASAWVGPGTGLDDAGVRHKAAVVEEALDLHRAFFGDPLEVLRRLGGREQAALAGCIVEARRRRIPVMLDGFICCASALVVQKLDPDGLAHCQIAHRSKEPGHARMIEAMGFEPILDLGMRLGEGSGAAVALGILEAAVACHNGMATFAEAGVAGRDD
ncbi:MAG: nicotinate-nucleotide--dimethylbenzimidazole phosphoribosyltransferase [Geminicoccaceae bacterium]|nr:nicotinate-nucleotide--dimethylbenzimidazole phosphoribosyltransferase [Geminicoccaceae bacterium]